MTVQNHHNPNTLIPESLFHAEVVGLLPAGGKAARIAPLPCSKELYPVGFHALDRSRGPRPKVVSHYLLEKMRAAGIIKTYIILREGKWDIPAYFGDGKILDMHLAYLMLDLPYGVPFTLDQAYPFVTDAIVAFGFPDILFKPDDAFIKLLAKLADSRADIVLGLFRAHHRNKMDLVDVDADGRVLRIHTNPVSTNSYYTWVMAVWTPVFTNFMHTYLRTVRDRWEPHEVVSNRSDFKELSVGDIIQAAIDNDLQIEAVHFPCDSYIDIGTADNLVKAVRDGSLLKI